MLGYRYYDSSDIKPLFPFGFGLSYTDFRYSGLKVSKEKDGECTFKVSFTVENTGDRDGAECAQVYVRPISPSVPRPLKELKGFDKKMIAAGEKCTMEIILDKDAFSYYDEIKEEFVCDKGKYEILVGSSSEDIRLKKTITISGKDGHQ